MLQQEVTRAQQQWHHCQQRLEGLLDAIKAAGIEGEQRWLGAHSKTIAWQGQTALVQTRTACQGHVVCWPGSRGASLAGSKLPHAVALV